jgi:hypothetical protein
MYEPIRPHIPKANPSKTEVKMYQKHVVSDMLELLAGWGA